MKKLDLTGVNAKKNIFHPQHNDYGGEISTILKDPLDLEELKGIADSSNNWLFQIPLSTKDTSIPDELAEYRLHLFKTKRREEITFEISGYTYSEFKFEAQLMFGSGDNESALPVLVITVSHN